MSSRGRWLLCAALVAAVCLPASAGLLEYVAAPEPQYHWSVVGQQTYEGAQVIYIRMTPEVWQGITWMHNIALVVPATVQYPDKALLVISGGSSGAMPGSGDLYLAKTVADAIGAPVALLPSVPNQPLFGGLSEDALIAHTFVQFLDTGDETWPALLPMTKSAVKAMDTIQAYARQTLGREITGFVVTGASKRGWTTWLAGAADPGRVKGIAPMVIDMLNWPLQWPHQLETWGDYSAMIDDYTNAGLLDQLNDAGAPLVQMVDPYSYRDRLTMPKLIINGANDPYWVIDALNLYWVGLTGPKWVLYDPNSGHDLDDQQRVLNSLVGFFHYVAGGAAFPTMTWKHDETKSDLTLSIQASPKPVAARVWAARSDDMDFRNETWQQTAMSADKKGVFAGSIPKSNVQNTALFGEAEFNIGGRTFTLSTQVRVVALAHAKTPPGRSAFGRLRAGAAKVAITPPMSMPQYLAGYDEDRIMRGVHDDIWARALYLTDGRTQLVLASLDLIGMQKPDLDAIAAAVGPTVGANVIITNTHTHSGPDVIGLWGRPWDLVPGWDENYIAYVKERATQAILQARQNARPAFVSFGSAMTTPEDRIAWNANERWFQADSPPWEPGRGRGPQDYEVSVMRVVGRTDPQSAHRRYDGSDTIATVFNFACHPEVTGSSDDDAVKYLLSADVANYAYQEIESAAGGTAIWLQGALGAMVTADEQAETWAEAERIGRALGQRALQGAASAELEKNPQIACASQTLSAPLYNETFYWGLLTGLLRGAQRAVPNESSPYGIGLTTSVSAIQIGGLQIATTPGEAYPKIGLNIKQNILTAPHKMVLGLAKDELGYIMYPFDYGTSEYGYETSMSLGPNIGVDVEAALRKALAEIQQ